MSREVGDAFEKEVADLLDLQITANSGAKFDNADLYSFNGPLKNFVIELKVKSIDNFRAPKDEIEKLKKQALKFTKDWAYIQKNNSGSYILMDLNAFAELVYDLCRE